MMSGWQMIFMGGIFFVGTAIVVWFRGKDTPFPEDPFQWMPLNDLMKAWAIMGLGFCLFVVGTILVFGRPSQ